MVPPSLLLVMLAPVAHAAETFAVEARSVPDEKAVFATVESRNVVPARTRIGGTVTGLAVKDGDEVTGGELVATVQDEKLQLQIKALDAEIAGLRSQLAQAEIDLAPTPLTLIGIVPGHWLFGAPVTATSMIGFIALAGIIVRNSILLVDFIRHGARPGLTLGEVLLEAGAIGFRPILLTALSAMIGAATIPLDPIFQGLAISLLFALFSSTLLAVLVIPAIYVVMRDADRIVAPLAAGRRDAPAALADVD